MSAGCICIGSKIGGIPEIIKHKKNGYLINPSLLGVMSGINWALSLKENQTTELQKVGYQTSRNFSADIMFRKLNRVYASIL